MTLEPLFQLKSLIVVLTLERGGASTNRAREAREPKQWASSRKATTQTQSWQGAARQYFPKSDYPLSLFPLPPMDKLLPWQLFLLCGSPGPRRSKGSWVRSPARAKSHGKLSRLFSGRATPSKALKRSLISAPRQCQPPETNIHFGEGIFV